MKTLSLTVSSFVSTSLSHCFSLLSAFLYSKPFQNNWMLCEIIDRYFNIFFVEIQLKKENLKHVFLAREFRYPTWYSGLPNGLNTSLWGFTAVVPVLFQGYFDCLNNFFSLIKWIVSVSWTVTYWFSSLQRVLQATSGGLSGESFFQEGIDSYGVTKECSYINP